jgi:MoaA/NifB/PqqE/SkfB family radical SAM enzyme
MDGGAGCEPPLVVLVRVTTACNLACGFCAYDRRLGFPRVKLADAALERLFELLASEAMRRRRIGEAPPLLSWIGGEPLRWRPWPTWSRRARAAGIRVSATSNGSTLADPRERAAVLAELDELTLSLDADGVRFDGLRGWPGGAERLESSIRELVRERAAVGSGLKLRVNTVLMRSTIAGYPALARRLAGLGVDELCFNALGGRDRPEFHVDEALLPRQLEALAAELAMLREELATQGCRLIGGQAYFARLLRAALGTPSPVEDCDPGTRFLFVDEHGRVAPCAFTAEEYGIPLSAIGTLTELPGRFREARRARCAMACNDCPSTQVFGKFAVDSTLMAVAEVT